ncbi:16S rRNA (cytidine(1402)-2'-O)-methyltransferase [Acidithiobacillus sp.]
MTREGGVSMQEHGGQLTIIATPIGNLDDLSPRAARAMAEAELILVEDSRHAQRLFRHLGLRPKTLALHEHNERDLAPRIAERIASGERIALLSDAGMPLLSDPGYPLLAVLRARQLPVQVIPGPNAALAALVLSGLPSDRFAFEGFLPAKGGARRARLDALRAEPRTLIFYEAPHRITAALQDMVAAFGGQRPAALCRELTKIYEECLRYSLGDLVALLAAAPEKLRGEMTLVVAGAAEAAPDQALADRVLTPLLAELPLAQAVRLAAALSDIPHRVLYELALEKKRAMDAE